MKHPAFSGLLSSLRSGLRPLLAALLALSVALTAAGCSRRPGSQVAGAEQQLIYGYLLEVNGQTRTVTLDPVELVAGSDYERLARLGATLDRDGRSYVYNARRNFVMYPLAAQVNYDFGDRAESGQAAAAGKSEENGPGNNSGKSDETGLGKDGGPAGGSGQDNAVGGDSSAAGGIADNNAGKTAGSTADKTGVTPGNSVSGNTTVGGGTATDDSDATVDNLTADSGLRDRGYGYTGVQGGLFSAFSDEGDRLRAYLERYDELLCRVTLENGQVTGLTVCTGENM